MVGEAGEGIVTGFIDRENPLFLLSLDGKSVYVPSPTSLLPRSTLPGGKSGCNCPKD